MVCFKPAVKYSILILRLLYSKGSYSVFTVDQTDQQVLLMAEIIKYIPFQM